MLSCLQTLSCDDELKCPLSVVVIDIDLDDEEEEEEPFLKSFADA